MSLLLRASCVVIVALPGALALFFVLRAFFDGNLSDMRYAFGLLILYGLALMVPLGGKAPRRKRVVFDIAVLAVPVALIIPFTIVVLIFGKVDAAAFVFHLIFGIEGTPWDDFAPYIFTSLTFWGVAMATYLRLLRVLPDTSVLPVVCAAGLVLLNPLFNDISLHRANAAFGPNRTLLPEFRQPVLNSSSSRPDLVVIYLEGFDRGYMDPELFGNIAEPLRNLEKEGTSFTTIHQIEATGWSLAGTIATQCGAPLLPFGANPLGDTSKIMRIMPEITCLPDILSERGYDVTYMSGAKIIGNQMGFYGFDNFFTTHGGATILDRDTIPTERTAGFGPDDWGDWGIFDSELFDGARKRITALVENPEPFAVFIATMDTHGPMVGISPTCTADRLPRMSDEMTRAVACVSSETVRFVKDIQRLAVGRDLRIAVFSDHLSHGSNVLGVLEAKPRLNTAMLLGAGAERRVISRPAAMTDLFPTLLDWIGMIDGESIHAGIGTSLLSDQPTLIERKGLDEVNDTLKVDVEMAGFLWAGAKADQD